MRNMVLDGQQKMKAIVSLPRAILGVSAPTRQGVNGIARTVVQICMPSS